MSDELNMSDIAKLHEAMQKGYNPNVKADDWRRGVNVFINGGEKMPESGKTFSLDNTDWLAYPMNEPLDGEARNYDVVLKDGTLDVACWWLGGWYCYPFPFDVVGYKREAR